MLFSIIVATRDRPELLRRALRSIAAQTSRDYELILLEGSSTAEGRAGAEAALRELVPGGVVHPLAPGVSGPSRARNVGIEHAGGEYLAFLDDDDEWVDRGYLRWAGDAVARLGLDLHVADQEAVRPDGAVVPGPVWTEDLGTALRAAGLQPFGGTFVASPAQMLRSQGFAHLNTVIIRRRLAADLGGFDPAIPYEEDRDFYLRAIDAAGSIGYSPLLVARHYVPADRPSASGIAQAEKDAFRVRVLEKALGAKHEAVRGRARRDLAFTLRRMAERAWERGDATAARRHARAAVRVRPGAGPLLDLIRLYGRSAAARRSQAG